MLTNLPAAKTALFGVVLVAIVGAVAVTGQAQQPAAPRQDGGALQALCSQDAVQALTASVSASKVTVKQVGNGPFKSATRYVAADGKLPAYCQVTGTFVTNPQTGKTSNFLATFPANWNGKFLQSGCSGHCGQFAVSNPATPSVTVTAQGWPGQIIEKGYAHFATDEGHESGGAADWALRKDGTVDQDFVDDWFYRADLVLAKMGKQLATAFYGKVTGKPQKISRSYFNGCSGGGRDALVASSYFPEQYDGIIGGSAYNPMGLALGGYGSEALLAGVPAGRVGPAQMSFFDSLVKAQCDAVDGVKDGLIQNPAACNFRVDRDLPKCAGDQPGDKCFTTGQIARLRSSVTALTDEKGNVVQPGSSISELQGGGGGSGGGGLGGPVLQIMVNKNRPNYTPIVNFSRSDAALGQLNGPRPVVQSSYVATVKDSLRMGVGHLPENMGKLMKSRTKFLMWHNWSDEALTPYMSVNWYGRLAKDFGGYSKVQNQVRLFMIPGTSHCSISGIAPNSFDALKAIEDWVERGKAPDALVATVMHRQFSPGAPQSVAMKTPNATQLLCKFPTMARYKGTGDVKDARNWSCPAGDTSLLKIGETGKQVGATY